MFAVIYTFDVKSVPESEFEKSGATRQMRDACLEIETLYEHEVVDDRLAKMEE